jgi:DNA-binding MarR family transcriptional regulator
MATRPIGYWIKEVDRLLDETFAHALDSEHCTRRHWQLLNALEAGPSGETELVAAVAPFAAADPSGVHAALEDLLQRGWTEPLPGSRVQLTPAGRGVHARLHSTVAAHRRHIAEGVTEAEYRTTVAVLERMAANLEAFLRVDRRPPG